MSKFAVTLKSLRTQLDEAIDEAEAVVTKAMESGDGSTPDKPITLTAELHESYAKAMDKVNTIRGEVDLLVQIDEGRDLAKRLREPAEQSIAVAAAAAAALHDMRPGAPKGLGEAFTDSELFKAFVKSGRLTMDMPFEVKGDLTSMWRLSDSGRKDIYTDLPTGTGTHLTTPGVFGARDRDPLIPRQHRQTRVRDLFPARRTTAAAIEYFRVTGLTNNASVIPERTSGAFTRKPQSGLTFEGFVAPVRTVAHWEAAHRNVLADEPQLQGIIEDELLYGLRLHEDYQILNGTGTGEDLTGILTTTGLQTHTQASVAGDNKADAIRRAITKAALSYYTATGVVVHDSDWEDIELLKSAGSEKLYLFVQTIADGGPMRVWRLPIVATQAIAEGTALVGAFGVGAQLYDREEGNIRISEHHEDFFVRNAIVVLAEQRLALAVKRPESFVKVTFT